MTCGEKREEVVEKASRDQGRRRGGARSRAAGQREAVEPGAQSKVEIRGGGGVDALQPEPQGEAHCIVWPTRKRALYCFSKLRLCTRHLLCI